MRRSQRLIAATILASISIALAGCSSGNFDPTDLMDWFDTKKKLPGERKPVFPEGVPGVEQGVPTRSSASCESRATHSGRASSTEPLVDCARC